MNTALLHGGDVVAQLSTTADTTYNVDVTDYVIDKADGKYIFVLVAEEPSACQYMNLTFDVKNVDLTGNASVANGVVTVEDAAGIRIEDAFGSGEVVTAGETYTVSVLVKNTGCTAATYALAPAYANGTKGTAFIYKRANVEDTEYTLRLNGLNSASTYKVYDYDTPGNVFYYKGADLMNEGITVKLPEGEKAIIYMFSAVS